jgi:hypothetical protein
MTASKIAETKNKWIPALAGGWFVPAITGLKVRFHLSWIISLSYITGCTEACQSEGARETAPMLRISS